MKIKYRLLPVEPYEVSALETWLSDLSSQGLQLLEIKTSYSSFWVKEPKRMLYRMEPKKYRKEDFPAQDKLRLYGEYGWKYVTTFGEYFHIYTAEEGTPEIHTDPIVESELYHVFLPKKNYALYLDVALWVFLLTFYIFDPVTLGAYQLVHSEYFFALAMPLVCILEIFISSRRIYGLWRVYKQLALGIPFSHVSNWRGNILGDTPFDYALLLQKDDRSIFYMILGNKMLEADYIGGQDLTQCCDLFLEVLQKDYHR